jgi:hypothetical protein
MHPKVPNKNKQIFAKISFTRSMPEAPLLFEIDGSRVFLGNSHSESIVPPWIEDTESHNRRSDRESAIRS